MKLWFNDEKTAQAAAYLLKLSGGRMNYMALVKLLHLADRAMLLEHGCPITGDRMISTKNGPALSQVLDFINEDRSDVAAAWFKYISVPSGYDVQIKEEAPTDEMSRFEMRLLEKTHDRYGSMDG